MSIRNKIYIESIKYGIIFFTLVSLSCSFKKTKNLTIKFEKEIHDFGELKKGDDAYYYFKFHNTGKKPLILQYVKSTCGCTIPEWSKEKIDSQNNDSIKVMYNTNRLGFINETITVFYNSKDSPKHLFIKGNVVANAE